MSARRERRPTVLSRREGLLLPLALFGCAQKPTAQSVAEQLLDAYYIERDLQKALAVTEGAAKERVREEAKLVEGAGPRPGGPRVYYRLEKSQPTAEGTRLTYELTIDSDGVEMKKRVAVDVRKLGEGYKVAAFAETDLPAKG